MRLPRSLAPARATTSGGRSRAHGRAVPFVLAVTGAAVLSACAGGSTAARAPTPPRVYTFGVVGSRGKIAALEHDRPTPVTGITGRVVRIASSNSDGYALTSNGAVWAWGAGAYGELGNGTAPRDVSSAVEVRFPAGVRITSLADPMPFDGALAIDATGHAWSWGLDADGDLCSTRLEELEPVRLPLGDVTLATGARTHSLLDAGGRVYACGSGEGGALGTGSTASVSVPTPVVDLPAAITALTSSWEGSGALAADGAYYDWGYNPAGQLGDGGTADSAVPVHVALPAPVRHVFQGGSGAGNGQTVAVLADGSVWAWGDGSRGQLGDGARVDADVPVRVDVPAGVRFVGVASGGYTSYAIDGSGRLWAWGGNQNGQLGTGGGPPEATRPTEVGVSLSQISSTASNVVGLGPQE